MNTFTNNNSVKIQSSPNHLIESGECYLSHRFDIILLRPLGKDHSLSHGFYLPLLFDLIVGLLPPLSLF